MTSTVYLRRADRANPAPTVRELMEACGWRDLIPAGASVVVKPNLCTERPEQIHTANTSAGVLRAVCEVLRERTDRVTIVESDGARYPAEAAFENNGVYRIAAGPGAAGGQPVQGRAGRGGRPADEGVRAGADLAGGRRVHHPAGPQDPRHDRVHRGAQEPVGLHPPVRPHPAAQVPARAGRRREQAAAGHPRR